MHRAAVGGSGGAAVALVLAAALLTSAPARAEEAGEVIVRVQRGTSGLEVEGRCRVEVSRADAWNVLTDYDAIDRFVSSMRESRITGQGEGYVLVEQVAVGRLFLFSRRMHATLRVTEEPPSRIRFEDVLHRDFVSYAGDWRIVDHGEDVEIVYRVNARPAFSVPDVIARGMFKRTVRELLAQVATEIGRRARHGDARAHEDEHDEPSHATDPLQGTTP